MHNLDFDWRRQAEEERDRLFELANELMIIAGSDGFLRRVSAAMPRVLGWSVDELLARPYIEFVLPEDRPAIAEAVAQVFAGRTVTTEARVVCKDGSHRLVSWTGSLVSGSAASMCAVGRDLTHERERTRRFEEIIAERTRAEESLRLLLDEKAVLLREVQHRVKNNLAVIASQLYLQSTYATDSSTIQMLHEMRDRVRSMALVHEILYQSGNPAALDAAAYVRALSEHLVRSYRSPLMRLSLDLAVDPLQLPIDQAIPCGLILTELLTNCVKHAFAPGMDGRVRVSLRREDGGRVRLDVSDTGGGLPVDFDAASSPTLGLRLVRSLASQIDASLEIARAQPGTRVTLAFSLVLPKEPVCAA
jgi:PAS domain S-box-containing protein